MNIYVETLLIFIIVWLVIFLINYKMNKNKLYLINNKGISKKNKKKKIKSISEFEYIKYKFQLNSEKHDLSKIIIWISLINSFIISFTSSVIILIPLKLIWQLLIAFVVLFALIYSLYEIYGRHLKNLEEKDLINKVVASTKKKRDKKVKEIKKVNKNKKE